MSQQLIRLAFTFDVTSVTWQKYSCDDTEAYMTETHLWCHSIQTIPERNLLVISQQLIWHKHTCDVTAAILAETHLWGHSLPTLEDA